jgi:hypothetical protein
MVCSWLSKMGAPGVSDEGKSVGTGTVDSGKFRNRSADCPPLPKPMLAGLVAVALLELQATTETEDRGLGVLET